jgi:hypothetical protein
MPIHLGEGFWLPKKRKNTVNIQILSDLVSLEVVAHSLFVVMSQTCANHLVFGVLEVLLGL